MRRMIGSTFILMVSIFSYINEASATMHTIKLTPDIELQQLTEHVWLHITYTDYPGYGRISANGVIVADGETAAMIDTPWNDAQTARLFEWVQQDLHATIEHVIVGHAHDDCMGGLAEAHRRGATSYALDLTISKAQQANWPVPRHSFSDALTLKIGDTELRLRYFGGGHTEDNIVVWIPAEHVLFGGCLIKSVNSRNLGNVEEADLQSWPDTVRKVIQTFPDAALVVPGHGASGGPELLAHTLSLAEHGRNHAQ